MLDTRGVSVAEQCVLVSYICHDPEVLRSWTGQSLILLARVEFPGTDGCTASGCTARGCKTRIQISSLTCIIYKYHYVNSIAKLYINWLIQFTAMSISKD